MCVRVFDAFCLKRGVSCVSMLTASNYNGTCMFFLILLCGFLLLECTCTCIWERIYIGFIFYLYIIQNSNIYIDIYTVCTERIRVESKIVSHSVIFQLHT